MCVLKLATRSNLQHLDAQMQVKYGLNDYSLCKSTCQSSPNVNHGVRWKIKPFRMSISGLPRFRLYEWKRMKRDV